MTARLGHVPLGARRVHVWHAEPERVAAPQRLGGCLELLDPGELARLQRLRFEAGRRAYLAAHALLCSALSAHAPVDPRAWRFRAGERGKPAIAEPRPHRDIAFSVSRTPGCVACAVALGREIGIDVEDSGRLGSFAALADLTLSPTELQALHALPAEAQRERFLACWTLKEAYLKARGLGLSVALQGVSFRLDGGPEVHASFDPSLGDDPAGWRFFRLSASPAHPVAVAIRCQREADLAVEVHQVAQLPLAT